MIEERIVPVRDCPDTKTKLIVKESVRVFFFLLVGYISSCETTNSSKERRPAARTIRGVFLQQDCLQPAIHRLQPVVQSKNIIVHVAEEQNVKMSQKFEKAIKTRILVGLTRHSVLSKRVGKPNHSRQGEGARHAIYRHPTDQYGKQTP